MFKLLALALFAAAPAFASDTCHIAGLPKITGLSYHMARAKLIEAGFFPVESEEHKLPVSELGPGLDDTRRLGYFEASTSSQGNAWRSFSYSGFTVIASGCEDMTDKRFTCTVKKISCP